MTDQKRLPTLRTTRDMIRGVAERWRVQYGISGTWTRTISGDSEKVYKRLLALPDTATAKDVEAIIGNDSWTRLTCDQCDREVDAVVELGQRPDYASHAADICLDCLRTALNLAGGQQEGRKP